VINSELTSRKEGIEEGSLSQVHVLGRRRTSGCGYYLEWDLRVGWGRSGADAMNC